MAPTDPSPRAKAAFLAALGVTVAVVSAIGVLGRGDLAARTVESVRGETYELVTSGVYAWNGERLVAEGVGWDVVTLFLVVPALLATAAWVARGSLRARLLAIGLLAYLLYQYLMYAMAWAAGPLLLPFVVLYATSLVALGWFAASIPRDALPRSVGTRFPRRAMIAFSLIISLLLVGMWLPMVLDAAGESSQLHGQTTLVVQALDLGLIVPLGVTTAVLLWRQRTIGTLLAIALAVKGAAMGTAISSMVLFGWRLEGDLDLGGLVIFALAAVVCVGLVTAMLRAVDVVTSEVERRTVPTH